jgi:hypothetical protein
MYLQMLQILKAAGSQVEVNNSHDSKNIGDDSSWVDLSVYPGTALMAKEFYSSSGCLIEAEAELSFYIFSSLLIIFNNRVVVWKTLVRAFIEGANMTYLY